MNIREIPINFKNAPEPQSIGFREYLSIFLVLLPFMIGTVFFYFVFDHPIFSMFLWMVPVTVIYIFAMSIKLTVLFRFWNIKSFFAGLFKWLFTNVAWGWFIIISWLLGASLILSAVAWDVSNNFMPTVKSVIAAINTAHQNNIDEVEAQKTQAAAIRKAEADKAAADKVAIATADEAAKTSVAPNNLPTYEEWGVSPDQTNPEQFKTQPQSTDTQEIVDRAATILQQQGYNITSASTGRTTVGIDGKEHNVRFINWDKQPAIGFTTRNNIKSIDDQKSLMADPTHAVIILDCGIYNNRLSGCVGVEDEYKYMSIPWFPEMLKAYKVPPLTADEDGRIRFPIILH